MLAHLALREGECSEDRALGAAGAKARRAALNEIGADAGGERVTRVVDRKGQGRQLNALE